MIIDCVPLQAVCVTDPQLARAVLRCKELDKFHFQYSQLYPVSPFAPDTTVSLIWRR